MLLIDESESARLKPLINQVCRSTSVVGESIRLEFLVDLSKTIMKSKEAKVYPDLITFGYSCRRKAILSQLNNFSPRELRRGWGRLIHIAPANVPINFAFSFLMGFVSGNSNIVRLPTKDWPQVNLLVQIISALVEEEKYVSLRESILFIRTKHNSPWLTDAIKQCDGLLVWGGDQTVSNFRALQKSARCVEMYFPNRVSSFIISGGAYLAASEKTKALVAQRFYNDTYVVDQNACSSPSQVFWVGSTYQVANAKIVFWESVKNWISVQDYRLDPVAKIDRYLDVLQRLKIRSSNLVIRQYAEDLWVQEGGGDATVTGRYGTFIESSHSSIGSAARHLRSAEQTLTYYGFDPFDLVSAVSAEKNSIDRVVPVGQALNIGFLWDGVNLLEKLSRHTEVC